MLRGTVARRFLAPSPVLLLSGWTLFVKRNAVKGQSASVTIPQVKAKWDALTPAEKDALKAEAALLPKGVRKVKRGKDGKKKKGTPRAPGVYALFVKEQMVTLTGPVTERMAVIAQRWKAKQQAAAQTAANPVPTPTPVAPAATPTKP